MKLFGIEILPWQVAFLQQWGLLPGGKSAGENVDDRTKINTSKLVFDGSENDPYRQHPPVIPQEVWDAALKGEPAQQSPKALTYPLELPPEFVPRESPFLAPTVDEATTQRALDYIKAGQGQPYVWPGYDDVHHDSGARGLFQFQPGTFGKLDKLLIGEPVTTTMASPEQRQIADVNKRNQNQRKALRQLNKSIIDKSYVNQLLRLDKAILRGQVETLDARIALDAELHARQVKELQTTIDRQDRTIERLNRTVDTTATGRATDRRDYEDDCAIRDSIIVCLETKVRKLKGRNKNLRRKLKGSGSE